jgi:hypothetical protein
MEFPSPEVILLPFHILKEYGVAPVDILTPM